MAINLFHRNLDRRTAAKLIFIGVSVSLSCLLRFTNVLAENSPLEVIRTTTNQALEVLKGSAGREKAQRQQELDQMWEVVLPKFDTEEIARRSLATHWQELTEEQKKEFTQLFIQLVKKNYSGTLARYTTDAQFFFDNERIEGEQAEVQTRIKSPSQDQPFSVVYRLHRKEDSWLIYDVVAENVSLVQNYRNQFSRIIAKSSVEGLFDTLKQKLEELSAT
jgi:phospholipid transport system substrate-binding protein